MEEPHQRTRSGKLVKASKKNIDYGTRKKFQERKIVSVGIQGATSIDQQDDDDEYATYVQTPSTLTTMHVELLSRMTKGYGITSNTSIDINWRKTWNIGSWNVGNKIWVTVGMKQPNISSSWATIKHSDIKKVDEVANTFRSENLDKSTCSTKGTDSMMQLQGRWTLHLIAECLAKGIVNPSNIEITSLNISGSRIFFWVVFQDSCPYLCFITNSSIDIIIKYLPDWVGDIKEPTSAGSLKIILKNPPIVNDSSSLSINTDGWLSFNGRPENLEKLCQALSITLHDIMKSVHLKQFLNSLVYKTLDTDNASN